MRHGLAIAVCLVALAACGQDQGRAVADETPDPPSEISASAPTTSPTPAAEPALPQPDDHVCRQPHPSPRAGQVLVFYSCGSAANLERLAAFTRPVEPDAGLEERLEAALTAYFHGPTQAEGRHLFAFGPPGTLNDAQVVGDRAIIDVEMAGGIGSTAAQSSAVWTHLQALAFQFPQIEVMEPRWDGSCESFGFAVQAGECLVATRARGILRPDEL